MPSFQVEDGSNWVINLYKKTIVPETEGQETSTSGGRGKAVCVLKARKKAGFGKQQQNLEGRSLAWSRRWERPFVQLEARVGGTEDPFLPVSSPSWAGGLGGPVALRLQVSLVLGPQIGCPFGSKDVAAQKDDPVWICATEFY